MKQTRFILLFFTIASISQFNFCAQQLTDLLTQESYISPAMQWAIVSCFKKPDTVVIDTTTGTLQGMQGVPAILQAINQKMNPSAIAINTQEKDSMLQALHTMLEGTDIALITASIKVAYKDAAFLPFAHQLPKVLEQQKQLILTTLSKLQAQPTSDKVASSSSYFSWWNNKKQPALSTEIGQIDPKNANLVIIPASLMESIIQLNDYKTKSNATLAANLLFQQCFIAQQQHKNNRIALNVVQPISANNYIFTNFANIYDNLTNTYPICEQIIQAHGKNSLQALLQVRQAIQTALYIANKNSIINIGYILPTSITSYLDGIVGQLTEYDNHLAQLCTNPLYGGTANPAQSEQWSTVTKLALGALGVGAVTGAILAYDPQAFNKASDFLTNQASQAINWFKGDSLQKDTNSLINKLAQDEEIARLKQQAAGKAESDRIAEEFRLAQIAHQQEQARLAEQARLEAVRIAEENERARLAEIARIEEKARVAEIARLEKQAADLQAHNNLMKKIGLGTVVGLGAIAGYFNPSQEKDKEISRMIDQKQGVARITYQQPDKTQYTDEYYLRTGALKSRFIFNSNKTLKATIFITPNNITITTEFDSQDPYNKIRQTTLYPDGFVKIIEFDRITSEIINFTYNYIDRKNVEKNIVININHLAQANYDFSLNPFHEYSEKEINDIYKKIALNHHPDKGGDQEIFKRIANGKEHLLKYLQDQIILNAYDNFSFDEVDDAVYKAFQNIRPARPIPTGDPADMIYNGGNEVKGGEF